MPLIYPGLKYILSDKKGMQNMEEINLTPEMDTESTGTATMLRSQGAVPL